jgi:bifunctional non-homologous end joining protein LigD
MTLARTREAFDHADFVFELKYDGFRALAYVDGGSCRLVSRKNHVYKAYAPLCEWIGKHLRAENAVLDGELACLDEEGKPQFNRLLRRRGEPVFVAFDLLWLNGRDLRGRSLLDRKGGVAHADSQRKRLSECWSVAILGPQRDGATMPSCRF